MACCRAFVGIEVRDYDRSKWYLHTMVILSLSFSKTLLQKQQFEKSSISNKRSFGFQKSLQKKEF
jgi:hypothetical protein